MDGVPAATHESVKRGPIGLAKLGQRGAGKLRFIPTGGQDNAPVSRTERVALTMNGGGQWLHCVRLAKSGERGKPEKNDDFVQHASQNRFVKRKTATTTQQPTLEIKPMKTIILVTAMFLTVVFARPVSAQLTLFDGYTTAVETAQFIGDKVVIDGNGSGNSTLGTFSFTYHVELDPVFGRGVEKMQFTFDNGDTWCSNGLGLGESEGLGALSRVTELGFIRKATGRFAGVPGNFVIERIVDQATGITSGAFHGQFGSVE